MRTIQISAKCSDMFGATLKDNGINLVRDYDGYVPKWFPNPNVQHYGDYVDLVIDIDTGQIVNWKKPSDKSLFETFKSEEDAQ